MIGGLGVWVQALGGNLDQVLGYQLQTRIISYDRTFRGESAAEKSLVLNIVDSEGNLLLSIIEDHCLIKQYLAPILRVNHIPEADDKQIS